jgi:hypothetical protein
VIAIYNRWLLVAAGVGIVVGCATTSGIKTAPLDSGEAKFYKAPLATVYPATKQAVMAAGLDVDQAFQPDSGAWMIIAKKGLSMSSYGELVRIVVQQIPSGPVAVRVVTKRRLATNITAKGDWSGPIFENLDRILSPHS